MAFIIGEQYTDEEVANVYELRNRMTKAGFNDTAFSIGTRLLKAKGFITTKINSDYNGNECPVCALSDDGVNFILKNTHLFDLQQSATKDKVQTIVSNSDDLPF